MHKTGHWFDSRKQFILTRSFEYWATNYNSYISKQNQKSFFRLSITSVGFNYLSHRRRHRRRRCRRHRRRCRSHRRRCCPRSPPTKKGGNEFWEKRRWAFYLTSVTYRVEKNNKRPKFYQKLFSLKQYLNDQSIRLFHMTMANQQR